MCLFGALPVDIDADVCDVPVTTIAAPSLGALLRRGRGNFFDQDTTCAKRVTVPLAHQQLASAFDHERDRQIALVRHEKLYIALGGANSPNKITLERSSPAHLGHVLFHSDTGFGAACASCHPEGGDDGHTWQFQRVRFEENDVTVQTPFDRRTNGEFEDLSGLMTDVFTSRMGGFEIIDQDAVAIEDWLTQLEPEPGMTLPPAQQALLERGAELFESTGCAECHVGEMLTDFQFYDVGTGGMRKTPPLRGISQRNRIMSDGCADSLEQRFNPDCGGGEMHGTTEDLSTQDRDALVAYLETL